MSIQLATSDAQVLECFSILSQLRPHIKREDFLAQIKRQQQHGYQLAFLGKDAQVIAVAGFHIAECLAWGKYLYVFDLVVGATERSQSYGQQLFEWLIAFSKLHNCQQLHLDSGVQRFAAHRFYLQQKMNISSHHFSLLLNSNSDSITPN